MSNYPVTSNAGTATTGIMPISVYSEDKVADESVYEKEYRLTISKSIAKEKIKQFKLGKYTEKYIRTYLEFILMEGIIDNLSYREYLKEIGEKI